MDVCEDVIVKAGDIYHYQGPGQFDPDRFRVEVSELGFALVSDLFVFSVWILTLRHLRDYMIIMFSNVKHFYLIWLSMSLV